jgi:hypothetical protein
VNLPIYLLYLVPFVDDFLYTQLQLTHFKYISLLEQIPLAWKRLDHQPERFAYLREIIKDELVYLLSKFIHSFKPPNIDHDWWHYFLELLIFRQKRLVETADLDDPYLLEVYREDLGVVIFVFKMKIEERVISLFPASDYQAPINQ